MTVYRRRQEYGMIVEPSRSLSNEQLQSVLRELQLINPCFEEKMIIGRLRSMGYQIHRSCVRECVSNAGPINSALRYVAGKPHYKKALHCTWS